MAKYCSYGCYDVVPATTEGSVCPTEMS